MDKYDAAEQAYINGYTNGLTKKWIPSSIPPKDDNVVIIHLYGKAGNVTFEDAVTTAIYDRERGWELVSFPFSKDITVDEITVTGWIPQPD